MWDLCAVLPVKTAPISRRGEVRKWPFNRSVHEDVFFPVCSSAGTDPFLT